MTCDIHDSLCHREARVEAMRTRALATAAEMDAAAHLSDWPRYDRLRAAHRDQYDAYWAEFEAWDRARIEATYPECEE